MEGTGRDGRQQVSSRRQVSGRVFGRDTLEFGTSVIPQVSLNNPENRFFTHERIGNLTSHRGWVGGWSWCSR
ncbi:hypothetical protein Pmani_022757 [Petrolisthes manimaculis]|uniref:Uncharacterized protein n=1 Tax=Petrolisthes manimaculis TaxID=1843537 RepID=A0AAE1U444_9EUCA|nr:hypothetical protein Pmani_022757 [Petrolisthes manimaculis]